MIIHAAAYLTTTTATATATTIFYYIQNTFRVSTSKQTWQIFSKQHFNVYLFRFKLYQHKRQKIILERKDFFDAIDHWNNTAKLYFAFNCKWEWCWFIQLTLPQMLYIALWISLRLPSCGPGFESQAQHLPFFNL